MTNPIDRILIVVLMWLLAACSGGSGGSGGATATTTTVSTGSTSNPFQPPTTKAPSNTSPPSSSPSPEAPATRLTVNWTIPTHRENGSPLAPQEIHHYEIYYFRGDMPAGNGSVITVYDPSATAVNFSLTAPGTYYFAIASIDNTGTYSDISDPVSIDIP